MEKILSLSTERVVDKTLLSITQMYENVEIENRDDLRGHHQSRFPGFIFNRLKETVAMDTFFPSVVSVQGHNFSQIFVGEKIRHMGGISFKNGAP